MINGIEILNTIIVKDGIPIWAAIVLGVIILVIGVVVGIICSLDMFSSVRSTKPIVLGTIIGLVLGIWFSANLIINEPYKEIERYEVIISDDVNLNEFNDKYTIVEQRDKIYVIEEK